MAILKIARMGHPVLQQRADAVGDPAAPEVRRLIADLVETLADADGAGLAAPQVHVAKRIVLFRVPAERTTEDEHDEALPLSALINPVIEPLTDETALDWEGCLSIPGMMGEVPRATEIRYSGVDIKGEPVTRIATGFHARVVQHECDHLDGILYPMRIEDLARFGFTEEMQRIAREEAAEAAEDDAPPELEMADGETAET